MAKGYGKHKRSTRGANDCRAGRLSFCASYEGLQDLAHPLVDRCDPELILIAMEQHQ